MHFSTLISQLEAQQLLPERTHAINFVGFPACCGNSPLAHIEPFVPKDNQTQIMVIKIFDNVLKRSKSNAQGFLKFLDFKEGNLQEGSFRKKFIITKFITRISGSEIQIADLTEICEI